MSTMFDQVTDLTAVFGTQPGEDRVLIDWDEMCDWLDQITHVSPWLSMETIGLSTEGREMRMVIASSPETLADLDAIRSKRLQLRNTSNYHTEEPGTGELAGTKPVVLITAGIHATEVGGVQMMPEFIRDLATESQYHEILEHVILLIIPTLNPDGMDLVHDWYKQTLGTKSEGTNPPALYNRYAGHDNNRDWYQRHLKETQVVIDEVHRVWFPHVVVDLHQMGQRSPRYVVPPYIDPAEIHVHPLIYPLAAELGSKIAVDHSRAGNHGVCSGVMFDCYSPTRAYMHYHGGVRILAEAASAGIASPVRISEHEQHLFWDVESQFPSVHMPLPWRGGTWTLRKIIDLHRQTIDSVLQSVASQPSRWIADQWKMLWDQVNTTNLGTLVIAPLKQQFDPAAARELIDLLRDGDVEVYVADEGDDIISAGSFVIPVQQPFGSYASALLALSIFPPKQQSYDVTSHCLPVHMGVETQYFDYDFSGEKREPTAGDLRPFKPAQAEDIRPGAWLAIDSRSHASIRLVNHALKTGSIVHRLQKPQLANNRLIDAGSWVVADTSVWDVMAHAADMHVRTTVIGPGSANLAPVRSPRLGIYNPQHGSASDYGWLTLWLERAGFEYTPITGEEIMHGALDRIDTLLVPHAKPDILTYQHARQPYPAEFTRGLSDRVVSTLRTWLHRGGHLIAFEGAVTALSKRLVIDLHEPLLQKKSTVFASSGAVVTIKPNLADDLALGIDVPFPAMYFSPHGYELHDSGNQHSVAKFAREGLVISGAMTGEKQLEGLHAVVQMSLSEGHFTAFAYRPHFRTQMMASEQLLTNAIMQHVRSERTYS